jgi:hypothetical protein
MSANKDKKKVNSAVESKPINNNTQHLTSNNNYIDNNKGGLLYKAKSSFKFISNFFGGDDEEENEIDETTKINRNYWYRGEVMQLVEDAFKVLVNNDEIVIEQKIELLEVLAGCSTKNRFNIWVLDKNDKTKKYLFKGKEESFAFCRKFIPKSCRKFFLRLVHYSNSNKEINYRRTICDIERKFRPTCLFCCFKPTIEIYYNPKNLKRDKKYIGKAMEVGCASPVYDIYDENGNIKYKIYSDYCQCGLCCRFLPLGKCYEVNIWIYDADCVDFKTAVPVGNIHKVFKGLSELVTESDAMILTFPKDANEFERLQLLSVAILIDFDIYEETKFFDCGHAI